MRYITRQLQLSCVTSTMVSFLTRERTVVKFGLACGCCSLFLLLLFLLVVVVVVVVVVVATAAVVATAVVIAIA